MPQQSSFPDMSHHPTFQAAFADAHRRGGSGHVFNYKGKQYTTDRADGREARVPDNRGAFHHEVRRGWHNANEWEKNHTGWAVGDRVRNAISGNDRSDGVERLVSGGGVTSAAVDRQRAEYHKREAEKQRKREAEKTKK
mmetsp:Transcript_20432/g.63525  ORF Transcript_20432/g.63525 Transcript_20432/m.63525 type:complete len:139 (-) Transcript_20432:210-626(-)